MSEEPLAGPQSTTDRFIKMLENVNEKDAPVFEKLATAQEDS